MAKVPNVYLRGTIWWIRYRLPGQPKPERESSGSTSWQVAVDLLKQRQRELVPSAPKPRLAEKVLVNDLLDALRTNYVADNRASLRTLDSHLRTLRPLCGHMRALNVTTDLIEAWQARWQEQGNTNATINRRCNMLRRAFRLAVQRKRLPVMPYVPRRVEKSPRGKYISDADFAAIEAQLAPHLRPLARVAKEYGTRKGQLARTRRQYVDLARGVIEWPLSECKHDEPHVVPLAGDVLAVVRAAMKKPPLWCRYLFHGAHCAAGKKHSKDYGCVGDFKKAWAGACKRAGFPVGRKAGGFVFHHTRNTAVTNLPQIMSESEAMVITGHLTRSTFDRYGVKQLDAIRAKLENRPQTPTKRSKVTSLRAAK